MNFANFKAVTTANTRDNSHLLAPRQNFNFKYKKAYAKDKVKGEVITSAFTVSNNLFEQLGLDSKETGAMEMIGPDETGATKSYLALVDNDNAVYFKTTKKNEGGKKGSQFKSSLLEKSLIEQGIIEDKIGVTQKLDLTLVAGSEGVQIDGITIKGLYEISKAAESELTAEEKEADAKEAETTTETQETETSQVSTTGSAGTTATSEDDF